MGATFTCPNEVVISAVVDVREGLLATLRAEGDLALDGSNVERVDGAGVQLLFAFVHEARQSGRAIRITPSPALCDAIALAGLTEHFAGSPEPEPRDG